MKSKSSMTKAELIAECGRLERENEELRDRVDTLQYLSDAYFRERNIIDKAHGETIKELIPLVDMRTELHNKNVKHALGGKQTPYDVIHIEARKLYQTGEYKTPWAAAKKAVKLARMNPGEFGTDLPGIPAVNANLKNWLKEQK